MFFQKVLNIKISKTAKKAVIDYKNKMVYRETAIK